MSLRTRNVLLRGLLVATLSFACMGCADAKEERGMGENSQNVVESSAENDQIQESAVKEGEDKVTPTPEPTPSAEELYADMVSRSLTYEGNTYRLRKFIDKLRAGENVTVAMLGGSVTEGAGAGTNDKGYAYQFLQAIAETYGNGTLGKADEGQIRYVVAGLSGTPSVLGLMRYEQDVLEPLGGAPDLLVIEFAVNDWQEATEGRAYESMVYEALTAREDCAVIALCSVAKTGWNTQNVHLPIAKHYQIPLVSLKDAVFITEKKMRIDANTYFMDDYHPKFYGHKLMKDCLMNLFEKADDAVVDATAEIPENAIKGRDFTGMIQVDSAKKEKGLKVGSFGDKDEKVVTTFFTKSAAFPNNFYHKAGSRNEPFTLTVKCKKILINFKTTSDKDFGKADFYVDGKLVATADGHSDGGWNNCNVLMVLDEAEAAKHVLEVKMAAENEDKAFTIFSISYVQ